MLGRCHTLTGGVTKTSQAESGLIRMSSVAPEAPTGVREPGVHYIAKYIPKRLSIVEAFDLFLRGREHSWLRTRRGTLKH